MDWMNYDGHDYSHGMTAMEVRNDLINWGVDGDIIREALGCTPHKLRELYNAVCEDILFSYPDY